MNYHIMNSRGEYLEYVRFAGNSLEAWAFGSTPEVWPEDLAQRITGNMGGRVNVELVPVSAQKGAKTEVKIQRTASGYRTVDFPGQIFKSLDLVLTALAKKKGKEWDPNPFAVCHTTVDKDKDPEKWERCVQEVKKKQE